MTERETIHKYLKSLTKYLARLDKTDAQEVIKEIESHILDVIESKEQANETVDVQQILSGFGAPRDLAAQYVDHVLTGSAPPEGFNPIQRLKRGVTRGLWLSMACFGYFISAALGLIGLVKILYFNQFGVWSSANGNSIAITFAEAQFPQASELLGWWLIPIALIGCLLTFWLTRRVLAALKTGLS